MILIGSVRFIGKFYKKFCLAETCRSQFLFKIQRRSDLKNARRFVAIDAVFNIYAEAGAGLSQHGQEIFSATKASGVSGVKMVRNVPDDT